MYAISKCFKASGSADILVAAKVSAGSADQVLGGKHYRRGFRCILMVREALMHFRLNSIVSRRHLPDNLKKS